MEPRCRSMISVMPTVLQLLLVVLFASQAASAPTDDIDRSPTTEKYCGVQPLNATQICCIELSEKFILNVPSQAYRCCVREDRKPQHYHPSTHMCDDGKVVKLPPISKGSFKTTPVPTCGGKAFEPSKQICCRGLIHDIPSEKAVCCFETAYQKNDSKNACIQSCGNEKFHVENQLCCEGAVHNRSRENLEQCCGGQVMNPRSHDCCGNLASLNKSEGYLCCNDKKVYHNETMRCDQKTGRVHLKYPMSFNPADLCSGSMVTWQARWPTFIAGNITIKGLVQSCDIKVRVKNNEELALIPLSPFSVTSGGLKVPSPGKVFKIRVSFGRKTCAGLTHLKQYLKSKTIIIHTQDISFLTMKNPEMRIKRGHQSFILLREPDFDIFV